MKFNNCKLSWIIIIILAIALLQVPASVAKTTKKVAILPFNMNADRDLTFLQEGIIDMIRTRLAWKGEVEILEKGIIRREASKHKVPLDTDSALAIGKALQADYVILGSLTVFGESVSIDARIFDVVKSEELITAFNQTKGMDEVIPTVNQFAQDINSKIMGRYVAPSVTAGVPERKRGPGGLISGKDPREVEEVGYTQTFNIAIRGLDVGDVDGDGKNELVLIDADTVYVYKWKNDTFAQFRAIKGRFTPDYVYVSVGDLDHNGRAEIYVSNLTQTSLSSFVLEWQGNSFNKIASGQRWFFRITNIPGKGKTLIGQGRVSGIGFSRYVYILNREGGSISKVERLDLPPKANTFNFIQGDITDAGGETIVLYPTPTEYLFLFDPKGEEIWRPKLR